MLKHRSYWLYSLGLAVAWSVIVTVVSLRGHNAATHNVLLVLAGFAIGWTSATIARFVYPPPKRWLRQNEER